MRFPPRVDYPLPGAANMRRPFLISGVTQLLSCILLLLAFLQATDVLAHGRSSTGPVSGISIPNLSHGEMAVLTTYRSDIMGVADKVKRTDPSFRRLQNYAAIQYSYCFWGAAPGTITDEASPFNECAHAYLAAAKALLLYMRAMPNAAPAIAELVSQIDTEMIRTGAAFIGCQYSGGSFNTAGVVTPHWENVPAHMPTMAATGGLLMILASPVFFRIVRRSPR
ncbi:hypothetical protein [Pararhizobium sp. PWRC1-1]|uniref:hypothetical protein n=1 Tax=Pararhizobium sp. PWRC1-1 TaxID=2804566 RepID=UPI003CE88294